MSIIDTFKSINEEYEDKLFNIFKNQIDKSLEEADKKELSPIYKYDYVYWKLEEIYVKLAIAMGGVSGTIRIVNHSIYVSETLEERINNYFDIVRVPAQKVIIEKAQEIKSATNMGELSEKIREYQEIMALESIARNRDYFEGIDKGETLAKTKHPNY